VIVVEKLLDNLGQINLDDSQAVSYGEYQAITPSREIDAYIEKFMKLKPLHFLRLVCVKIQ
jgi:hypothetical protein